MVAVPLETPAGAQAKADAALGAAVAEAASLADAARQAAITAAALDAQAKAEAAAADAVAGLPPATIVGTLDAMPAPSIPGQDFYDPRYGARWTADGAAWVPQMVPDLLDTLRSALVWLDAERPGQVAGQWANLGALADVPALASGGSTGATLTTDSEGRSVWVTTGSVQSYLQAAHDPGITLTGGGTVIVVCAPATTWTATSARTLISKKQHVGQGVSGPPLIAGWQVILDSSNNARVFVADGTNQANTPANAATLMTGSAVHSFGLRYDPTADRLDCHVDGIVRSSVSLAAVGNFDGVEPLRLGLSNGSTTAPFAGRFYAVAIFDRALSDAELARVSSVMRDGWTPSPAITRADVDSLVEAALSTPAMPVVADATSSWWSLPRYHYDPVRDRSYASVVSRAGMTEAVAIEHRTGEIRRQSVRKVSVDDHNVPAMLVTDDRPVLIASAQHNIDNLVRVYRSEGAHDLGSLTHLADVTFSGNTTYAQLVRRPGTDQVALMTRSTDGDSWWVCRSSDWGETWDTPRRLFARPYMTYRANGDTLHFVTTQHPTSTTTCVMAYFQLDASTGAITDAAGAAIDNLWDYTAPADPDTVLISGSSMTVIGSWTDPDSARLYDVAPDGSIIIGTFTEPVSAATVADYKVLRRSGATWTEEPLTTSGVSVGYYESVYNGGACFGADADTVYLVREDAGVWTLERWRQSAGAWERHATLLTRSDGTKLMRPWVPTGGESRKVVCQVVYRYSPTTFTDYLTDLVILPQ